MKIGDQTGIVNTFVRSSVRFDEGENIYLQNAKADIFEGQLQLTAESVFHPAQIEIKRINYRNNVSRKIEQEEDEDEVEQKPEEVKQAAQLKEKDTPSQQW